MSPSMFPLTALPDDVLLVILTFLAPFELYRMEQTNKRFRGLVKSAFLQMVRLNQEIPHQPPSRETSEREDVLKLVTRCGKKLRFIDIGPRVNYIFHMPDGPETVAKKCPNIEMMRMIGPHSLGAYAKAVAATGRECKVKVIYTSPVLMEYIEHFPQVTRVRTVYLEGLANYVRDYNQGIEDFGVDIFSMSTPWDRVRDLIQIIKMSKKLAHLELRWWFGDADVVPSEGLIDCTRDFIRPPMLKTFKFTIPERMLSSIHGNLARAVTHLDVNAYSATYDQGLSMSRFSNITSIFMQEEELFKAAAEIDFPHLRHLSVARSAKHNIVPWGIVKFLKKKGKQLTSIKLDYSLVTAPSILTIADFIVLYCPNMETIKLDMHYVKFAVESKVPQMEVSILQKLADILTLKTIELKMLKENSVFNNELMQAAKDVKMTAKSQCSFIFNIS